MNDKNDYAKHEIKDIRDMTPDEIEHLNTLGLDDTFHFACKACGNCCKQRRDIVLTPYDIFRLAKYLSRTPEEIIKRYCDVYEGENSHFPVVWLMPVPPDDRCPFLINRKCVVHTAKPVLCRIFPLARIMGKESKGSRFYFNGSSCHHDPKTTVIRDWIGDVASEDSENAGILWADIVSGVLSAIHPRTLQCSKEKRAKILNAVFCILWLPYDTEKDFAPQLEQSATLLREHMQREFNITIPTGEHSKKGEHNEG